MTLLCLVLAFFLPCYVNHIFVFSIPPPSHSLSPLIYHSLFSPWSYHLQSLSDALISLQMVYPRRNLSADQWRNAQLLSLISAPSTMLNPAQSDTVSMASI